MPPCRKWHALTPAALNLALKGSFAEPMIYAVSYHGTGRLATGRQRNCERIIRVFCDRFEAPRPTWLAAPPQLGKARERRPGRGGIGDQRRKIAPRYHLGPSENGGARPGERLVELAGAVEQQRDARIGGDVERVLGEVGDEQQRRPVRRRRGQDERGIGRALQRRRQGGAIAAAQQAASR